MLESNMPYNLYRFNLIIEPESKQNYRAMYVWRGVAWQVWDKDLARWITDDYVNEGRWFNGGN